MHRTGSNQTALTYVIYDKNIIIASEQRKKSVSILMNFVKSRHFLIFFLRLNLAIKLIKVSQQVLLGTLIKDC